MPLTSLQKEALRAAALLEQRIAGIREGDPVAIACARRGLKRVAKIAHPKILSLLHTTIIDELLREHGTAAPTTE